MTNRQMFFSFQLKDVDLHHLPHFLKILAVRRNEILPIGVFIAHKPPIDAENEIKQKNVGRHEMQKPNPAEKVPVVRLAAIHHRRRLADEIASDTQTRMTKALSQWYKRTGNCQTNTRRSLCVDIICGWLVVKMV